MNENRIVVLYDAITRKTNVEPDWGFAALVEFEGRRILFDTGNNPAILDRNTAALGVDLTRLDFAMISHRHGDHTTGLKLLHEVNPSLPIYVPYDEYFGGPLPQTFFTKNPEPSLPPQLRYFGGVIPGERIHGSPWAGMNFQPVTAPKQIDDNMLLLPTKSEKKGTRDLCELSLVLKTTAGLVVIAGCSHTGIEKIVAAAMESVPGTPVRLVLGGLHLVEADAEEIDSTLRELIEVQKVQCIGAGHCSGERAFSELQRRMGERFLYAGAGEMIPI